MPTPSGGSSPTGSTAISAMSSMTASPASITPATRSCTTARRSACARSVPISRFFRSTAAITSARRPVSSGTWITARPRGSPMRRASMSSCRCTTTPSRKTWDFRHTSSTSCVATIHRSRSSSLYATALFSMRRPRMARSATRRFLASVGLPDHDLGELPDSEKRFPDGAHYRVEIPSTEGSLAFEAVLDEAERREVPVVRVSQGSGVFMHTDEELDEMARLGAKAGVEVSLFARRNAGWEISAMARAPVGPLVAPAARGIEQLVAVLDDARRAASHGFRSVLLQDVGALSVFAAMRAAGELPADMQAKVSVQLPVANPAAARVIADLGASTINLPTDLTLGQIAAIRAAIDAPLDIYVECPDNIGGFVRYHEIAEIVRVAAPVYLKFGLRGTVDPYPAGSHVAESLDAYARERVRRARLGLDLLARAGCDVYRSSVAGAPGLALPVTARAVAEAPA